MEYNSAEGGEEQLPFDNVDTVADRDYADVKLMRNETPSYSSTAPIVGEEEDEEHDNSDSEENEDGDAIDVDMSLRYLEAFPAEEFCGRAARYPRSVHKRIQQMSLAQNRLMQFPTCVLKFTALIGLDLSNNQLVSLSEQIYLLPNLRELSARNNLLEDLPKSLQLLRRLEVLNLAGNLFERIPDAVYELRPLKALYFGANRIEQLPSTIGLLTELEILYLGGNRLTEVPASLGRLTRLTSLVLADNLLESIPPTFADLRALRSLTLHNNAIRVLPTGIARLQKLEHLSLRNNPLVTRFVHDITFEPPSLKELSARIVKIRQRPDLYAQILPRDLVGYLDTANQCVNPKCRGVYFESCAELVKFVDFCGKFRVPLLHYICSPKCSNQSPAYAYSSTPSPSSSSVESDGDNNMPSSSHQDSAKMKKILIG